MEFKKRIFLLWVGLSMAWPMLAQPNFSEDIAPIIYNNCTSCHRPGEIAPFSLTNYNEVVAWAPTIKYVTEIKYMPPWQPSRAYSNFVGETGLSDSEIQLIADWVNAGTPQGDPALEPPLPNFPSGSQLGTPDLVLEMAKDYFIEGNNQDDYRVFVLSTGLTQDKEIAAIEFRPGNTRAVHHALLAYEVNGAAAAKDAEDTTYGYEAFGGYGVAVQGTFTGYTPGIQPLFFPVGIGTTLPAGADLIMQVHYAPLPSDETDKSKLNIFFKEAADPISRELQRMPVTPFDLDNGWFSFRIPPDSIKTFHGTKNITEDISMLSVYPHMHYLGKEWLLYAVTPTNDTINIIHIEDWDFNWQGAYTFNRMKKIPQGSVMHIFATYDNTSNNPYNPNVPPQWMSWGEGTADEMYLVGTTYVPYQTGDELIDLGGDSTLTSVDEWVSAAGDRLFLPYPNPTQGELSLRFYLPEARTLDLDIIDAKGAEVQSLIRQAPYGPGEHRLEVQVGDLPAGRYLLRMRNEKAMLARPLIISH